MKKKNVSIIIFVAVCSLFLGITLMSSKVPTKNITKSTISASSYDGVDTVVTLESLLPKTILSLKAQMTTNYATSMTHIFALDPTLKSRVKSTTLFDASFFDSKLLTQSGKRTVEVITFDQLITAVSAAADDKANTKSLLLSYAAGIAKASGIDAVNTLMCDLIKSSAFKGLSSADKDYFYGTFLANKIALDYGKKIGFLNSKGQPVGIACFDNNLAGKSFASLNATPYARFGCYFFCWVTPGITTHTAYHLCER